MPKTSWGKAAKWYDTMLEAGGSGTYQKDIIMPGILKLLNFKKGELALDLACGQGYFSRELQKRGVTVVGADISPELIRIARARSKGIRFEITPAHRLTFAKDNSFDAVIIILAIQNIDPIAPVFREVRRVLKKDGRFVLVMNHPAFRVPRQSGWGWDEQRKLQYRRVDSYMSEMKIPIQMHPSTSLGQAPFDPAQGEITWSFHRPLQIYIKALANAGFTVSDLEEWISHKVSRPGVRAKAENRIRKEIPMFLAIKVSAK